MKSNIKVVCFFAISFFLYVSIYSCRKEEFPDLPIPASPIPVEWTVATESTSTTSDIRCKIKKVKWGPVYSEFTCLDPQSDVLIPGGVFSYETIKNGGYAPIVGNRKPLTISASLSNITGQVSAVLEEPSLSSVREGMQKILQSKTSGGTAAFITWKSQEIFSKKYFDLAVGGNYGNWFAEISAQYEYSNSSIIGRYLIEYQQIYYSIDVDIPPPGLENWFENLSEKDQLGGYSPAYVSSVKYGRKIFFLIESKTVGSGHSAQLEAEFSTFFQSGGLNISVNLQKLINEKSIKAFIMGGPASEANLVVSNPSALKEFLQKGSNYSASSPGVPLSYTLRFVKDNSVAKLGLYDEFEVRECDLLSNDIVRFTPTYNNNNSLYPRWIGGDKNFDDDGPVVTSKSWLTISSDKKKIWLHIYFHAKETDSQWAECEDQWDWVVQTAPAGRVFDSILSDKETTWEYTDIDKSEDQKIFNATELVKKFVVKGDTDGIDIGDESDRPDQTSVRVWFNEVTVKLKI